MELKIEQVKHEKTALSKAKLLKINKYWEEVIGKATVIESNDQQQKSNKVAVAVTFAPLETAQKTEANQKL